VWGVFAERKDKAMSKTCPFLLAAWIARYGAEAERPTDLEEAHTACLGEDCARYSSCQGEKP